MVLNICMNSFNMCHKIRSATKGFGAFSAYNILHLAVLRFHMALQKDLCSGRIAALIARKLFTPHMNKS